MREELIIHSTAQPEQTAREMLEYFKRNGTRDEALRYIMTCRDLEVPVRQITIPAEDLEARVARMAKDTAAAREKMRAQGHTV